MKKPTFYKIKALTDQDISELRALSRLTSKTCSDPFHPVIHRRDAREWLGKKMGVHIDKSIFNGMVSSASYALPRTRLSVKGASKRAYLSTAVDPILRLSPAIMVIDYCLANFDKVFEEGKRLYRIRRDAGYMSFNRRVQKHNK